MFFGTCNLEEVQKSNTPILSKLIENSSKSDIIIYNLPYSHYYKPPLHLFLRLFGHSSRPRTLFFLASLVLLVRLLFRGVLYSRASYNSGNSVVTEKPSFCKVLEGHCTTFARNEN